ncbi:hypothetical protein [Anabaena azotica]|uniref:Uncharacterized protein n=1 Tax=Anabaena azotica FACHB-119 TaxID=947527 RepID=A0ABR8D7L3_9NOST|nr:hypothetical protein [Anabaena azotica]MBD2503170.1 hypothetical protein [Anabaena azotica FACHB-119]
MVKSNKKPNRLAELAKGLQEQTVQEQHSSISEPQQTSTSAGLFRLAERLVGQSQAQPQASHSQSSQVPSSAKTSKLFALDRQLGNKSNQPDSQLQPQPEVSQAQSFDRNEAIVVQTRDRETAAAFDENEPIVLASPYEETAAAFDENEPIVLASPDQEPNVSELSTAQAVQPLPLGSYLLESLKNPHPPFTVEPFQSFSPALSLAVDNQFGIETVSFASQSTQSEQTSAQPLSPPLTQTQVTELEPAASVSVRQVAPPLEPFRPDEDEIKEAMPDAIAQQPVTPDSEEPQPPMDAKALAMELLNILQAKQASQAQNRSPAAVLGLEIQDVMPSNIPSETVTEPQTVSATVISSFDELDKRLEVEKQQEEAISSAQGVTKPPLKPAIVTVGSSFDELDRGIEKQQEEAISQTQPVTVPVLPLFDELDKRLETEKQKAEAISSAQGVTEPEAKPISVTVLPSFDELDKRLEAKRQREKVSKHQQVLTESAVKTVTVTVIPSFDELDKRLETEQQESIPVVTPNSESNFTAQLAVEPTQELPQLNSSPENTLAEAQTKVETVESQAVAIKTDNESSSLWEVFDDLDRRLDAPEPEQSNPQSAVINTTSLTTESLSNSLELVKTEPNENLALMAGTGNQEQFTLDVYVTNESLGIPIRRVKVTLNQKELQVAQAAEQEAGHYIFKQVEPDKYSLQVKVSDKPLASLPVDIHSTPDSPLKLVLPGLYCSPDKELKERFQEFISWYLEENDSNGEEQRATYILNIPNFYNQESEKFSIKWSGGKIAFSSERENKGDRCFEATIDESGGSLEKQGGFIHQIYSLGSGYPPVKSYITRFISICSIFKTPLIGLNDHTSFRLGNHILYRRITDCFAYGQPYYAQFDFRPVTKSVTNAEKTELVLIEKPEFTLKDYYEACASVKNIKTPQLKEMIAAYNHLQAHLNIMQEANPCRDTETVGHWWRALHPEKNQIVRKEKEIQEAMFKFYQAIFTLEGCETNHLPSDWTECVKILSIQQFTRTPLNTAKFVS